MKPSELKQAFPSMPDGDRAALERTLHALPDAPTAMPTRRRAPRLIPALALLLILTLGTAAFAASREPILDWLLGHGEASEDLTAIVQPIEYRLTLNDVVLRVTGVVTDGESLSVSYEMENTKPSYPILFALAETDIAGVDIQREHISAAYTHLRWVPSFHLDVLPVQRNPIACGKTFSLRNLAGTLPEGETTVRMTFHFMQPKYPLVIVDERMHEDLSSYDDASRAEIEDQINTVLSFKNVTVAPADQMDPEAWIEKGYTPISLGGEILGDVFALTEVFAYSTLSIPLDLSQAVLYDLTPDAPIELDGYTAVVHRLTISPLATNVQLELIPAEDTREAAQALAQRCGEMTFADGEGNPLAYLDMDYLANTSARATQNDDGRWVAEYSFDMPGLAQIPDVLSLCFGEDATPLMTFAVPKENRQADGDIPAIAP